MTNNYIYLFDIFKNTTCVNRNFQSKLWFIVLNRHSISIKLIYGMQSLFMCSVVFRNLPNRGHKNNRSNIQNNKNKC